MPTTLRFRPFPFLLLCFLLLETASPWARSQGSGLDAAAPIGAYLNAVFPSAAAGNGYRWEIQEAYPNLKFADPVRVVTAPRDSGNAWVVCRMGQIWKVPHRANVTPAERIQVLDLRATTWGGGDAGLLGMAFHPQFGVAGHPSRGFIFVIYQFAPQSPMPSGNDAPSYLRLSRFTIPDGSSVANPGSEFILINQSDRNNFHVGGDLEFGGDGFLYLTVGDEGGDGDELNSAQRINDRLFSGVLRIDVDNNPSRSHPIRRQPSQAFVAPDYDASYTQGYSIPNDNPWVNTSGANLEEFWCHGFRSPHTLEYDAATNNWWSTDVGEFDREEINQIRPGRNYQWPFGEGSIAGVKPRPASVIGIETLPAAEYDRKLGGCIIGGMIYRGSLHSGILTGRYICGDRHARTIRQVNLDGSTPVFRDLADLPLSGEGQGGMSGISAGPDGECYICMMGWYGEENGRIFKLVRASASEPPATLSATGAFTSLSSMTPRQGLIPFDVNTPLFSDNAAKQRWLAVPNDGSHNTDAEKVRYSEDGSFDLPAGSVLVKHFAAPADEANSSVTVPVETRFLVRTPDSFYGFTYRWRADGSDADLVPAGTSTTRDVSVRTATGGTRIEKWSLPSRSECIRCHNNNAGFALGLTARQMDRDLLYPATGRTANQLRTLNSIGIFNPALTDERLDRIAPNVRADDTSASLDHKVSSWMDANCSHCHRPAMGNQTFDTRSSRPLIRKEIINHIILPQNERDSHALSRISVTTPDLMPPVGRSRPDAEGIGLLQEWIAALPADFPGTPARGFLTTLPGVTASQSSTADGMDASRAVDDGYDGNPENGSVSMTLPQSQPWLECDLGASRWVERIRLYNRTDRLRENLDGAWLMVSDTPFPAGSLDAQLTRPGVSVYRVVTADIATDFNILRMGRYIRIQLPGTRSLGITELQVQGYTTPPAFPALSADQFYVSRSASASVNVLANDTGTGLHTAAVELSELPLHGDVTIDPVNSVLRYTHSGDSAPTDRFAYRVRSPYGVLSAPASVDVFISGGMAGTGISPSVALTTSNPTVSGTFDIAVTFTEPVTGLDKWDFELSNATPVSLSGSGATYIYRVTPLSSGNVSVYLGFGHADDSEERGNLPSNVLSVQYSTGIRPGYENNPRVTLSGPASVTGIFAVSVRFSLPVTGLDKWDFDLVNATPVSVTGSGTDYVLTLAPSAPGEVTVFLGDGHADDVQERGNLPSNTLRLSYSPSVNETPVVELPPAQITRRGATVNVPFAVRDPDGSSLTVTASGMPPGISLNAAARTFTGSPTTDGSYNVTIRASDGTNTGSGTFRWDIVAPVNGLTGTYFTGSDFNGYITTRTDPTVNFAWGAASPAPGVPADYFSVRWTGCIIPPSSTTHTFYVDANNGVRLYVGGRLIINSWNSDYNERSGTAMLSAGVATPVVLEFMDLTNNATCILKWSSSTLTKQVVPQARLLVNEVGMPGPIQVPESAPVISATARNTLARLPEISAGQELVRGTDGRMALQFRLPADARTSFAASADISADLQTWTPSGSQPVLLAPAGEGGTDLWQFDLGLISAPRASWRLRLEPQ